MTLTNRTGCKICIDRTWDGHPARANEAVWLELFETANELVVEVDAPFHGDQAPAAPKGPTDKLWDYEVVELFIVSTESLSSTPRYLEIELGPHGHHQVLELEGARHPVRMNVPIEYSAIIAGPRWFGVARVDKQLIPPPPHVHNAYAMHGTGAARCHLALFPLGGPVPDFHRVHDFRPLKN